MPNTVNKNTCPLCSSQGSVFYDKKNLLYYQCNNCSGIFLDKKHWLNASDEKERYLEHNNNVEDKMYQKFVSPITLAILNEFTKYHSGLDFGAGTCPVISMVLRDKNYQIKEYDPFFHDFPELLKDSYDYIAICEVVEHFHNPYFEFGRLFKMLNKNGKIYCMTHLYDSTITFHNWYYMNDITHVFIYQKETMEWIKNEFGFSNLTIQGKHIIFSK